MIIRKYKCTNLIASWTYSGADPGFQVRGGALKKIAPSGGRHENVWGISCENHDFTPKNFFPILGGSAPATSCISRLSIFGAK